MSILGTPEVERRRCNLSKPTENFFGANRFNLQIVCFAKGDGLLLIVKRLFSTRRVSLYVFSDDYVIFWSCRYQTVVTLTHPRRAMQIIKTTKIDFIFS